MPVSGMGVVCIRGVLAGEVYVCLYQGWVWYVSGMY